MKIWHQSFTVLEDLPPYKSAMENHIKKIVRPDTEVEIHGLIPGTYPSNYPGTDIGLSSLYSMHTMQWMVQAVKANRAGVDVFAMCTIPNPLIREIRTLVDIPVVGYGESSFHLACMLGHRFGILMFIDTMIPMYQEQLGAYGLTSRCVGIEPVGFTFQDVLPAFTDPEPLIERFKKSARTLIAKGADVIVPGEMPLNILLASNGISRVDDVPIIDGLAVTMKMAEMMGDLKSNFGLYQTRQGWFGRAPQRSRVEELFEFYGLDKLLNQP